MPTADTPQANLESLKSNASRGTGAYATIKPQYTGSWHDDIQTISKMVGVQPAEIIKLNPWLNSNNFIADNHGYAVIKLTAQTSGSASSSGSDNDVPSGYYATNTWIFPLGVGTWYVSQGYKTSHTALDLTTGVPGRIAGSPVYASKAGTAVSIRDDQDGSHGGGWGNSILIRHDETTDADGNCYYTRYAHLTSLPTQRVGAKISQGDQLGTVGNTGKSSGYHLHYQIYFTSATRTDYGNFTGSAAFSVDPNTISDFPGIPWKEHQKSSVDYAKSPYITDDDMNTIIGAVKGDGTVTQSQYNEVVNGIADKICQAQGVASGSKLEQLIHDFVKKQLDGMKEQGESAVNQLLQGGNFYYIFDTFCQSVVNNAIWFIENKVGEVLTTAGQEFVATTKTNLKSWVFSSTNLDPDSETAAALGSYLDGYVDSIVQNGWSAVRTAITTGDVQQACQIFLENTKRDSIDFMCNVMAHGCATAITAYIPTIVDDSDTAKIATDLAIGILNVTVQSIGGVLKGDISIAQAAKNILSQAVISITSAVVTYYLAPFLSDIITNAIIAALEAAGITVGGPVGAIIAGLVGVAVKGLLNFLIQKLIGFFNQ